MNKYDKKHILNVQKYQTAVWRIYKRSAEEAALLAAGANVPDGEIFSFEKHLPRTAHSVGKLAKDMASDLTLTTADGIAAEWALSNAKNDALVDALLAENARKARYYRTHIEARDAFLKRQVGGLDLSDRVWNYTSQFKNEIELGIDCGIRDGLDAAQMARRLQQYLKHPDMLFRRVRDEHGQLQLSQRAAEFHPGQGVYRSSYKNARRLVATETNIAYRTADHLRWHDLDFVVGIEIELSNNHTCLGGDGKPHPFYDICDELKGKYPKDFKFTGWHPHCRCIATPILKTEEELEADDERIMQGEEPIEPDESDNAIEALPSNFNQWLKDNEERIERAKSQPYFLKDNKALITGEDSRQPTAQETAAARRAARSLPSQTQVYIYDKINDPNFTYLPDQNKLPITERVNRLLDAIDKAYGNVNSANVANLRLLNNGALAQTIWNSLKDFRSADHFQMYKCINHLNELRVADFSKVPKQWRGLLNKLIKDINAHDMSKGYFPIYSTIEYAYNIHKLSTCDEAIKYGLAKLSSKTPYNFFTEIRKKIADFPIPEKAFFERFDTFVPLMTKKGSIKGAYYEPTIKHVCIPINQKASFERLQSSKWYQQNLPYHEFGHAFDPQKMMATDPKLVKIYDDWKTNITKDNGASLEAKIKAIHKPAVKAFEDWWKTSKEKASADKAVSDALSNGTLSDYKKARELRTQLYQRLYREKLYDLEEQLGGLSDCLNAAIDGNRWINPRSHSDKSGTYFARKSMQLAEFIAHCSENYWGGNPYFKKLAPQLYKQMQGYIKGVK